MTTHFTPRLRPARRGWAWSRRRTRSTLRDAPVVTLLGLVVGAAASVPLVYLVWRASEVDFAVARSTVFSDRTWTLLVATATLAVSVTAAALVISLPLAWLTTRTDLPLRRFWVVATALPLAIPSYVGSFAVVAALGPRGFLQGWLEPLGVDRLPPIYGFKGAFAVLTLLTYPYMLLTVRTAYRHLDPSLEEASRTLGRGSFTTFVRVVLPQLRTSIAAGSLLVSLYCLSEFGAVSMLRYNTFTRAIYTQYRGALDRNVAALLGLVLVALTVIVLAGEQRMRQRERIHRVHASSGRVASTVHLGRWRWVAFAACALLVFCALVIPMSVIGYWMVRAVRAGDEVLPSWTIMTNSFTVSLMGAGFGVLAAWPVAVLSVRHPGRLSRLVERLSWLGYALPGLVVALALVFVGAQRLPWAYQTTGMLVFAYVALFLPQAIGAIRSSLLHVTPTLEEASHLLGAGRVVTFRRVILPLTSPGMVSGAALLFLTCMKELPATLLLSPTGFSSLATRVWTATSEAYFGRAAGAALILVLLSSLPMTVLVLRDAERPSPKKDQSEG